MTELEEFNHQCDRLRRRCFYQIMFGTIFVPELVVETDAMNVFSLEKKRVYVVVAWPFDHMFEPDHTYEFVGETAPEAIKIAFERTTPPRASLQNLVFLKKTPSV